MSRVKASWVKMTLTYTENVVRSFLRDQLTAYPFADERWFSQMRDRLSLETKLVLTGMGQPE